MDTIKGNYHHISNQYERGALSVLRAQKDTQKFASHSKPLRGETKNQDKNCLNAPQAEVKETQVHDLPLPVHHICSFLNQNDQYSLRCSTKVFTLRIRETSSTSLETDIESISKRIYDKKWTL